MMVRVDPRVPDEMLVALNKRDKKLFDVHRLNLKTGDLPLDTQNPGDVSDWTADNNMQVRAAAAVLPGAVQEIRLREKPGAPWKVFQKWGPDETFGGIVGFAPDNKSAWLISSVGAQTARAVEVDLASGREKPVAEDPRYDATTVIIHPAKRTLEAVGFLRAKLEWQFLEPSIKADFDELRKIGEGEINISSRDLNDKQWVVTLSASDQSPALLPLQPRQQEERVPLRRAPQTRAVQAGADAAGGVPRARRPDPARLPDAAVGPARAGAAHGAAGPRRAVGARHLGLQPPCRCWPTAATPCCRSTFAAPPASARSSSTPATTSGPARCTTTCSTPWAVAQGVHRPEQVRHHGRQLRRLRHAGRPDLHAGGVRLRRRHRRPVQPADAAQHHPAVLGAESDVLQGVGGLEKQEDSARARRVADRSRPLLIAQGANDPRVKQAEASRSSRR